MAAAVLGLALVVAALLRGAAAGLATRGSIPLDNRTIEKVLTFPGSTWLIKIDRAFPYGKTEKAYEAICKAGSTIPNFFVGEVQVQESADKEGADVQAKYGVMDDEFPAYFLVRGSFESRIRFEGFVDKRAQKPSDWNDEEDGPWENPVLKDPTSKNVVGWLRQNGVPVHLPGTIPELNNLVDRFMAGGMQDSVIEETKALVVRDFKLSLKAVWYIRIMEKVKAKGSEYLDAELVRVKKLLASSSPCYDGKCLGDDFKEMSGHKGFLMTPEKQEELETKARIMGVFMTPA